MTKIEKQSIIEMIVYILSKTGGLDIYHLLKTLYFAHRIHLSTQGLPLITDQVVAMKYGPVPSNVYDWLKHKEPDLYNAIERLEVDTLYIFKATREVNLDYIAITEQEALDEAIERYSSMPFNELCESSHDKVWQDAYILDSSAPMSDWDIALEAEASEEALDRLSIYQDLCV